MIESGGTCFYRKAAVPSIRDWKPTWLTSLFLANGLSRPSVHSIPNLLSWFPWYADGIGRCGANLLRDLKEFCAALLVLSYHRDKEW